MTTYKSKEIVSLVDELVKDKKIHNDRALFSKLRLSEENKVLLAKWIQLQCLLAERRGFEIGQDDIRIKFQNLLILNSDE
jgi:hypothetical protein